MTAATLFRHSASEQFEAAFASFDSDRPILVLTHNDADGLSAGAIFKKTLQTLGRTPLVRIVGRGETPWSDALRAEVAELAASEAGLGGIIVSDLGVRDGSLGSSVPAIVVDHHVPAGTPNATLISGFGDDPVPTTSVLAYRCMDALVDVTPLLWLAAVGLIGDLGEKAPFAELAEAKSAYTARALKEVTALVNAPRRSARGDARPAFDLLVAAASPKDALSGRLEELAALKAAREEVKVAFETGKRIGPRIRGDVALIELDTPCQIHPLVAQAWRGRLKSKVILAANHGYRPGWVHFAARSGTDLDLIDFLRKVAPAGADENYGSGHKQASGGALRLSDWPIFLDNIGFQQGERQ